MSEAPLYNSQAFASEEMCVWGGREMLGNLMGWARLEIDGPTSGWMGPPRDRLARLGTPNLVRGGAVHRGASLIRNSPRPL